MEHIETNKIAFWGFAFLLLIFLETIFFHNGSIVFVIIGSLFIYYGLRKKSKVRFFTGLIFIIISLFTLWSLRLFILIILINILLKLWNGIPAETIIFRSNLSFFIV